MSRVVFGIPMFNKAAYLEPAVESLLAQTFDDLAIVLIDDRSDDDSMAVAERFAARDARVEVHRNERRLGMLENTRRALTLALERHPEAEFWALGSDHDLWQPEFVARLVGLLDAHPDAVLAYPRAERIDEYGAPYPGAKTPAGFDTLGLDDRRTRLEEAFRGMAAGNMIYGLFRVRDIAALGHYRPVLVPDRLLLSELALRGTFAQAPEILWQRRFRGLARLDRQRSAFWPDGAPGYARLPWWLQQAGMVLVAYGVRGEGREVGIGRAEGVALAWLYLRLAVAHRFRRRRIRIARWGRRHHPRRLARGAFRWLVDRYGPRVGAAGRRLAGRLDRHEATRPLARAILQRVERQGRELAERRRETVS